MTQLKQSGTDDRLIAEIKDEAELEQALNTRQILAFADVYVKAQRVPSVCFLACFKDKHMETPVSLLNCSSVRVIGLPYATTGSFGSPCRMSVYRKSRTHRLSVALPSGDRFENHHLQ